MLTFMSREMPLSLFWYLLKSVLQIYLFSFYLLNFVRHVSINDFSFFSFDNQNSTYRDRSDEFLQNKHEMDQEIASKSLDGDCKCVTQLGYCFCFLLMQIRGKWSIFTLRKQPGSTFFQYIYKYFLLLLTHRSNLHT